MKKIQKTIELALALKGKSNTGGRCFHLTTIWNGSKLLSVGVNNYLKTHAKTKKYKYGNWVGTHSELAAVLKLGYRETYRDLVLVTLRLDRNGNLAYSKPCSGCADMLQQLDFKNIFFSNKNEFEKLT